MARYRAPASGHVRAELEESRRRALELELRLLGKDGPSKRKAACRKALAEMAAGAPIVAQGWSIPGFNAHDFSSYLVDGSGRITEIPRPETPDRRGGCTPGAPAPIRGARRVVPPGAASSIHATERNVK